MKKLKLQPPTDGGEPEQKDLFQCEIVNWSLKDDLASMDVSLLGLTKRPETDIREWRRGNKVVRIIPSSFGMANMYDKDLLLYITSQLVEALNQGLPISSTVHIDSYDFLVSTERGVGRTSYENILGMLRRLKGTTIETNIETGGVRQTEGFGWIDNYKITSEAKRKEISLNDKDGQDSRDVMRVFSFTVTLSDWLMNSIKNKEVLTLDKGYFKLTRSIDRRLYEIARKHCGDQAWWKCNIDLLSEKVGFSGARFRFREDLRKAINEDCLPGYRLALDHSKNPEDVVVLSRESRKVTKRLADESAFDWYSRLEKKA